MDEILRAARAEFPALEQCCWLVSHSLGCLPARAADRVEDFLVAWQERAAGAWDEWLPEIDAIAGAIGRLLSAPAGSVTMLTNVSQVSAVIASCFDYGERDKIVYSASEFPSVSYVWQGEARRGARIEVVPAPGGETDLAALIAAIDERTAVVPLSHVAYATGALRDVAPVVARAREVGAHVVLDAYQSIGALPIDVVSLGVSFATGGVLKYLCGGPGAAFLYVRPDLIDRFEPRVTGWFAHEAPFAFAMPRQSYAEGIWRYLGGTPAVAPLYQARVGLEVVDRVGVRRIRERSQVATARAIEAADRRGFTVRTPRDPARRSASVVFDFTGAADVARELNRRRCFCDHRPGAGLRIAPHFYNTDDELDLFFDELDRVRKG